MHNKCTVNKLSSNTINASGKHGVFIDCATAKTIKANTIQSPAITGVHVYNNSKVSTIANNQITSPVSMASVPKRVLQELSLATQSANLPIQVFLSLPKAKQVQYPTIPLPLEKIKELRSTL